MTFEEARRFTRWYRALEQLVALGAWNAPMWTDDQLAAILCDGGAARIPQVVAAAERMAARPDLLAADPAGPGRVARLREIVLASTWTVTGDGAAHRI